MTQQHTPFRPALTAIAAVLALSSTAALAQSADQAADPSAPTIAAPPPPAVSTPPVAVQSAEPAPAPTTVDTSAPAENAPTPVAPAAAPMATRSTPVVHQPDQPAASQTAARAKPVERATRVSHTTTKAQSTPPVKTARAATPAPAPEAAPAPVPATPPAPAATATTRTVTQTGSDNTLPIAGAVAVGLIALGGVVYAFSRRRREDEDELILAAEPTERTIVAPVATPAYAAATEAVTAVPGTPINTPVAARENGEERMILDNGFDLSRFGPHVRAAYRGPTADNPSHSLRKRLARARFFDQREREQGIVSTPTDLPEARAAAKTATADNDQIVVRPDGRKRRGFFGTAFQR